MSTTCFHFSSSFFLLFCLLWPIWKKAILMMKMLSINVKKKHLFETQIHGDIRLFSCSPCKHTFEFLSLVICLLSFFLLCTIPVLRAFERWLFSFKLNHDQLLSGNSSTANKLFGCTWQQRPGNNIGACSCLLIRSALKLGNEL